MSYIWNNVLESFFPPIILIHGVRSSVSTWTRPGSKDYDYIYQYNREPTDGDMGWHFRPPLNPVNKVVQSNRYRPIGIYQYFTQVIPYINKVNFSVLAFNQSEPNGRIDIAVEELKAWIEWLLPRVIHPTTRRPHAKANIIAHSRGGLVCRRYIQKYSHYNNKIFKVFTLGSPHSGSNLANIKRAIRNALTRATRGITDLPDFLKPSPADPELEVNGKFIRVLNGDRPVAGIRYYLVAGNNTTLWKKYLQIMKRGSFTPHLRSPPFHWEFTHTLLFDLAGSLSVLGRYIREIQPGEGDILVTKNSALGKVNPNDPSSPMIRSLERNTAGALIVRRNHGDIVVDPNVMRWICSHIIRT